MHPDRASLPPAAPEPVAIVGIAALYPRAGDAEAYWRLLCDPAPPDGTGTLDDVGVDVARFGIPPAHARSMARLQLLMLEAARQCLTDAGYGQRPLPGDRTDVVVGTCLGLDRQHANALRIEAGRYARELQRSLGEGTEGPGPEEAAEAGRQLRAAVLERLGGSPHDRVGEMASTIPARIAAAFGLHGRTLAVEAADVTSFLALRQAMAGLRSGAADAALVLAGQRRESPLLARALAAKGLLAAGGPFAADGRGLALGEGVGAVLLKRRSSAVADGDRVYASILDCSLGQDSRPGVFRYSTSVPCRQEIYTASYRAAAVPAGEVQFVECAGTGVAAETAADLASLAEIVAGRPAGAVALGSARDRLGHTFANAGLASLTKVALALYHRRIPPQRSPAGATALAGGPFDIADGPRPWPTPAAGARRAAVTGASLTGTIAHLLVEEHEPRRVAATRTAGRGRPGPEPVAVIAAGARFAGSPDAAGFRCTTRSGRDRIGPVSDALLDRELYFAPDELSLQHSYSELGAAVPVPIEPPPGLPLTPHRWAAMDGTQRLALTVAAELLGDPARGWGPPPGRGLVSIGSNLGLSRERELAVLLRLDELEAAAAALPPVAGMSDRERELLLARIRARLAVPVTWESPALLDGCLASGTAALIAHEYRLDAVPVAVEAACASALAAVDVALAGLRSHAVDFAVAGGVELPCNARDMVLCSSLGLLSRDRITPFDPAADGFTPGDGCALFLLRRLSDARRDGDRVLAVLRGVGASNDARSLIAPDVDGQVRAMRQAFDEVDFGPDAVDFLEAHGTGTRVGDRVEIAATAQVYGDRDRPLWIGSVKGHLGHTFAAAGAAGLLRALQAVGDGVLPPAANLTAPDPGLGLAAIPAVVPTRRARWASCPDRPRRAAVSSFGTGGINYHVLLEEHRDGIR